MQLSSYTDLLHELISCLVELLSSTPLTYLWSSIVLLFVIKCFLTLIGRTH